MNAVMEGAFSDNPILLNYKPFKFYIPDNAHVLSVGGSRFILSAVGNPEGEIKRAHLHYLIRGWAISDRTPQNGSWIKDSFDTPRAICTFDGRIFLNSYADLKIPYCKSLVRVWRDCAEVFYGSMSVADLNNRALEERMFRSSR